MMIICVCVCVTYLIDEPLFMAVCLLSYSSNSSSRAAAFSETCASIQSFLYVQNHRALNAYLWSSVVTLWVLLATYLFSQ